MLANNSQHCWISHVASVCTPTLLHVVRSCCTKFETGQKFIDVKTDATTPNMLGQQCWEFLHINSGKRTKSARDTVVLKFSFFLFFIPTEPVIWLVVLCSFRNTKQSPVQILRAFCSGQRGQERLWETGICHYQKTWTSLSRPNSLKTLGTRNIVTNSSFKDFVSCRYIKNSHQTSVVYEYK